MLATPKHIDHEAKANRLQRQSASIATEKERLCARQVDLLPVDDAASRLWPAWRLNGSNRDTDAGDRTMEM
jgi:hypothetical protein